MASHVTIQKLEKPPPSKLMLEGIAFWKWEDNENTPKRLVFKIDEDGFFLYARGEDPTQSAQVWDLNTISDVRYMKTPIKDSKLSSALKLVLDDGEIGEDCIVSLVIREDGLIKLSKIHLLQVSQNKALVAEFMSCVNKLAHHLLDFNSSLSTFVYKHYKRVLLEADESGQLPVRKIQKLMMIPKSSKDILNQLQSAKTNVKQMKDGTSYVTISELTFEIFLNILDSLLQNRGPDLDVVKVTAKIKLNKQHITVKEFLDFLNTQQRDPRLNTILYPYATTEQAKGYIKKYGGGSADRLTMRGLLVYLMNDENHVFDPVVFDRSLDMNKPINNYFINSSHNTYLNGHQVKSESLAEMYIQVLLTGCRCVELDCWPSGDNEEVLITHGNTLCTKITFKEVVEAINEFAFVASDYPIILSIENHCNRYPKLVKRMADIFTEVFGDKLLSEPFEDYPLEQGNPLPSPEKLKRKILIKDKVRLGKGGSFLPVDATIPRRSNVGLPGIPEVQIEPTGTNDNNGLEEKQEEKQEEPVPVEPKAIKQPPPLLSRPSLNKGMTILEEPLSEEEKARASKVKKDPSAPSSPNQATDKLSTDDDQTRNKMQKTQSVDSTGSAGDKDDKPKYESGEASASGPLNQLLNYCTAMSFQSFEACEELNCSYIMSSFHEEKGLGFIRSKPKDFVRYNLKQNSRVYPAGSRIASSNYMPQLFWNVGCQMVALNFQTSDMPMQVNYAKYEANMGTGYILKPSVLRADKGFNPFIQRKLEDIVPARLSVKIISGMFITKKNTNLTVELEMYGLPADLVRRQYTKKKPPAPHPFWNEDYFVFKRVLLPELALLRLAVLDDDHALVGQRVLPVEHLRAGFRHISLRNKHNYPLGMASIFVHIKIEDYVPDEYEEFAAALENPMKFVNKALEMMTMGTKEKEEQDGGSPDDKKPDNNISQTRFSSSSLVPPVNGNREINQRKASIPIELETPPVISMKPRMSLGATDVFGKPKMSQTLPNSTSFGQDSGFTSLREANTRPKFPGMEHDDTRIIEHPDYLKALKAYSKIRTKLSKEHDDEIKKLNLKHEKEIKKLTGAPQEKVDELREAQRDAISRLQHSQMERLKDFERQNKIDQHEKHMKILTVIHKNQRKDLDKIHKTDVIKVQGEMRNQFKVMKKDGSDSKNKDQLRGIEASLFSIGMQTRSELDTVHKREDAFFKQSCEEAIEKMKQHHKQEIEDLSKTVDLTDLEV